MGPDGRQVFEEGLAIPLMPLAREGRMNEDLMRIIRANVREPLQVEGDVYALAACNDEGSRRLVEMMEEFGIANLDRLGEHIIETSRQATIDEIGRLKPGKYRNSVTMDGYDRPLTLAAEMTIGADGIHVDYTGTSPASAFGINVVMNYTLAYTAFGVKCLVAPEVPNNAGSLAPITVSAPEGCLLNVKRPRAVAARHTVGHMLPDRRVRLPASGHGGRRPGRGRLLAVEPADLWRRRRAGRARGRRRGRRAAVQHGDLPLRRHRRAARQGRARRDRVSLRGAHDPGRGDRVGGAGHLPPPRVPRRLGRRRAGIRGGLGQIIELGGADGAADRDAVQFRAHRQSGARPRRRRAPARRAG